MSHASFSISRSRMALVCLVVGLAAPAMAADRKPTDLPDQVFVFVPAPTSPLTGLGVFPADVQLTTARDRQSIVVQATFADGITRDVTKEATIRIANPKLLKREGAILRPAADGTTTVTIGYGGKTVELPVRVAQATVQPPLSFRLDVMPVFMRAGCNTGRMDSGSRCSASTPQETTSA
jgi:hypothetical protein